MGWGAGEGAVLPRSQINFVGTRGLFPPAAIKGRPSPDGCPGLGVGSLDGRLPHDPPREIGERRGSPKRGEVFLSPQHPGAIQALSKPRGHPKHAWGRAPGGVNPDVPRRDEAEPPPHAAPGGSQLRRGFLLPLLPVPSFPLS